MNESQETRDTKQHIQIIQVQLETLAQLPSVKNFIELSSKRDLLFKTLPTQMQPELNTEEKE